MKRTHTCGSLNEGNFGEEVSLAGWVNSRRDHGGIIFIDLRDRYGLTQIVFDPEVSEKSHKEAEHLRREDVLRVKGIVKKRKPGMANPKLKTGEIEVFVSHLEVLNKADIPPLDVDDAVVASDERRLQYRYLDLRRPIMQKRLLIRHKAVTAAREFLNSNGFLEIETPMLVRHTPEGARDFVVPSRLHPGKVYSLPQSPQIYKQLLMVSGVDRYYQIARCMRDEDLRADRQPEFTQIDVEMSFVEESDIHDIGDGLMKHIFKNAINVELKTPFPRIKYDDAMDKYGSNKPDLRFRLELVDVSKAAGKSSFSVFTDALSKGGIVKCINAVGCAKFSRKEIDALTEFVMNLGAKGLAWAKVINSKLDSSIVKYFDESVQHNLMKTANAKEHDLLLFAAGSKKDVNRILGALRLELGKKLNLIKENDFKFCWVVDFPLFEWSEEEDRWVAAHHMFTMPKAEHIKYLETNPEKVYAQCYDIVLNGVEISSGSIRIHRADIQEKVMKAMGIDKAKAEEKFGFLLEAFKYGAPPHGGFAPGLDRLVALMCGITDIREVIAFPKTKSMECPMDQSPSEFEDAQLKELHLKRDFVKKK